MDKIEVTEDMCQRILQNIQKSNLAEKAKVTRFSYWKWCVSIAACLAVIFVGARTIPSMIDQQTNPLNQGTGTIKECNSVHELSQMVGFSVSELSGLPFDIKQTTYISHWAELAEIEYCGGDGQIAIYRKSIGTDDNSGNYNIYTDILEVSMDGMTITFKGDGGNYELALWTDGEYAYSIWLSKGTSKNEWIAIFNQRNNGCKID